MEEWEFSMVITIWVRKVIEWMERFRRGQTSVDDACSEQPVIVLS
jgi:hypothetical protein